MVQQSSWRRNDNVGVLAESCKLIAHAVSSNQQTRSQILEFRKLASEADGLQGQFTSG
jgi:hypothetical protein